MAVDLKNRELPHHEGVISVTTIPSYLLGMGLSASRILDLLRVMPPSPKRYQKGAWEIAADAHGARERVSGYHKEIASRAKWLIIFVGCCDSRVEVPDGIQLILDKDEKLIEVAFQYLPVIGAGAPDETLLNGVIDTYVEAGMQRSQIMVVIAQHGSHDEVSYAMNQNNANPLEHATCGARAHYGDEKLPKILADHLQKNMVSANIVDNGTGVAEKTRRRLYPKNDRVNVYSAMTDHNNKVIYFLEENPVFGSQIIIPNVKPWLRDDQNPEHAVMVAGEEVIYYPLQQLLRRSITRKGNNHFKAAATGESQLLKVALSEIGYATANSFAAKEKARERLVNDRLPDFLNLHSFTVLTAEPATLEKVWALLLGNGELTYLADGIRKVGVTGVILGDPKEDHRATVVRWNYPKTPEHFFFRPRKHIT